MGLGCYDEIKHLDSVLGSGRDPKGLAVSSFYKNDFSFHWALVPTNSLLKLCNCVLYVCVFLIESLKVWMRIDDLCNFELLGKWYVNGYQFAPITNSGG